MNRRAWIKLTLTLLVLAAVTLALEIGVFNFRALQSMGYEEVAGEIAFLDGVRDNGDGTITVLSAEAGERGIEFVGLNAQIKNAYIALEEEAQAFAAYDVFLMSTDAGNALYLVHPMTTVVTTEPVSRYVKLNLAGETPKMKLRLDALEGQTLRFDGVRFNVPRPFVPEPLRMAFVFCVLGFFYLLRVKGSLFSKTLEKGGAKQLLAVMAVWLALCVFAMGVLTANPAYIEAPWQQHDQYKWLAKSLAQGDFSLNRSVSPELAAMENPYDPYLRHTQGVEFEWDVAYFEGQYYCYFGVVPCVLFYLPFYLLTGYGLDNLWVVMLETPLYLAGVFAFFYLLLRRYAPKTRFATYLLLATSAALGSGTIYALRHPDLYTVPILTGLMLTVWGLTLWLSALEGKKTLRIAPLALGSLFMALVAGCRPQLVLGSGFALFLFAGAVREKKTRVKDWLVFWGLYVLVAAGIMYYNAARFGSPFDFGANYNLTMTDMTHLGLNIERAPMAVFASLFQPLRLTTTFPYLLLSDVHTSFQGTLVVDSMLGGVLHASPVLWMGALCFLWREKLREKKLYGLCLYSILGSVFLCAFDAMCAGVLYRYTMDFAIFLFAAAALTTASAAEGLTGRGIVRAHTLLRFFCAATAAAALMMVFAGDYAPLSEQNPALYHHVRLITEFWH